MAFGTGPIRGVIENLFLRLRRPESVEGDTE